LAKKAIWARIIEFWINVKKLLKKGIGEFTTEDIYKELKLEDIYKELEKTGFDTSEIYKDLGL